jgi:hypothetical protein
MTLVEELAATAELCGAPLSRPALAVLALDLDGLPEAQVRGALRRCRMEHRGRLTVEALVSRLDDGRPGPEEAWAAIPRDEATTVVWTDEAAAAFGVAGPLLDQGDRVAARMAFVEHYRAAVAQARREGRPAVWRASLGRDPRQRESALRDAVNRGRLTNDRAQALLPGGTWAEQAPGAAMQRLVAPAVKRLSQDAAA